MLIAEQYQKNGMVYMEFLTLDLKGALLALAFGVALLLMGLGFGYYLVLTMALFLFLSAIVTAMGSSYKKKIGMYQTPRGVKNVVANGLAPLIMATVFLYSSLKGHPTMELLSIIGFAASAASITADKFASEVGLFGGTPRMIFTFKKVKKGTSGGLTALGLAASLLASFIMASTIILVSYPLHSIGSVYAFSLSAAIASITLAGFIGNMVDSMFGYYEEQGIGNKFTSNFICSICGAVAAILIFMLFS